MAFDKIKSSTWIKINCALTVIVTILLLTNYSQKEHEIEDQTLIAETESSEATKINTCCAFPCQNGGVCLNEDKGYSCDCGDTGYFGKNCHRVSLLQRFKNYIKFNPVKKESSTSALFTKAINHFTVFQNAFNKKLYRTTVNWGKANFKWTMYDIGLVEPYLNISLSERSLPPIPSPCPTSMGIKGPKKLPSPKLLYKKLFKRRRFQPCPKGTNLLFATYIQHFVSQFDHLDGDKLVWRNSILDMSHIYGKHGSTMSALRSFEQGKLRSRYYKDEEYPPYLEDCPNVEMIYPECHQTSYMLKMMYKRPIIPKWALGNPKLSMTPMLFAMSTIWLREHNRVCTLLAKEHKHWTDEELYQTAKLIVTGEVIKITLTEYMKQLLQFETNIIYNPKLTTTLNLQYTSNIAKEFSVLPHWQPLMPEHLTIESSRYNISDILFSNNYIVFQHGLDKIIDAMATEPAGKIGHNSVGKVFQCCCEHLINESRALKVQSFNNYRQRFGLKPFESFEELTGNIYTAIALKELYLDIDAVELITGLLMEQKGSGVAPPTMTTISGAWLMRGLLSHPINSPDWWRSTTFGGELGMNIVKTASLKKLICLNMKSKCQGIHVDFKVSKTHNN